MRINREGYVIIFGTFCIALLVAAAVFILAPLWAGWAAAGLMLAMLSFVIVFFREPLRPLVRNESLVYAPADGTIVIIEEVEEKEYLGTKCMQVSVFMSLTNVHVNWFPVGGRIEYFKYHPGRYLVAWHPKSSELNERTTVVVNTGKQKVLFRQIAGLVARRIVSYASKGKEAGQNEKCGFIKFGSRVDVLVPTDAEILVKKGDKVTGSQTPLARLK